MLVNSAGIGIGGYVETLPAKQLDLQLGVNLRGLFLVTQAAIPLLRESRGWIVNLASIAGTLPTPGLATYGATKAAVISLTPRSTRSSTATACARWRSARIRGHAYGGVVGARLRRDDPARGLRRSRTASRTGGFRRSSPACARSGTSSTAGSGTSTTEAAGRCECRASAPPIRRRSPSPRRWRPSRR
jgi:NAD(P)-dependent dehydrogenase (short-subunit alcohol dehydrogenase family)